MERKVVLITGGSRGIGAACARRFGAEGYQVAVNYHRAQAQAEAVAEAIRAAGGTALTVQADVSDEGAVARMVDNVLDKFCQLDTLVCNAGISQPGLITDFSGADWRRLFAVNVDGVFYCCKAALPHMIHRKSGQIITISSMWGVSGASCEAPYSATKAAVIGFTQALAKELGPSGITVNAVAPGVVDTDMNAALTPADLEALKDETPLGAVGRPEDIAGSVWFLASDDAKFITGQVLNPNGGILI